MLGIALRASEETLYRWFGSDHGLFATGVGMVASGIEVADWLQSRDRRTIGTFDPGSTGWHR